jgi:hypothetical protein
MTHQIVNNLYVLSNRMNMRVIGENIDVDDVYKRVIDFIYGDYN